MTIDKVWELEKIELMKKYPFENQFWLFGLLIIVAGLLLCMFLSLEEARNKKVINESMKILIIALIISIPVTIKFFHDSSKFGTEKNGFFEKNESKILKYVDVESHDLIPLPGESKTIYLIYNTQKENVTFQYKTNQGNKIETLSKENTYFNLLENSETPKISKQEEQFASKNLKKEFGYQLERTYLKIKPKYKKNRYVLHIPNQTEYGFVDN